MIVSFETRMPSGVARSRASIVCGAAAEEVGVAQASSPRVERRRVDAEGVLQVGADVGVGVVDGGGAAHARARARSCAGEVVLRRDAGRRGRDDVGAERQLGVDARLLVVGRGEDAEVDAEGEQQPDARAGRG